MTTILPNNVLSTSILLNSEVLLAELYIANPLDTALGSVFWISVPFREPLRTLEATDDGVLGTALIPNISCTLISVMKNNEFQELQGASQFGKTTTGTIMKPT